jgi:acyl transferase domain-containing protein/NAD(P)-dependent dehydrogenase (short-subunit alcohol dehydrogenase family)/acyl carrier protein
VIDAQALRSFLVERLASVGGIDAEEIDDGEPLSSYGLDSAGAAAIAAELKPLVGFDVSPVLLFDHPSVAELVAFLQRPEVTRPRSQKARERCSSDSDPIAVVGIACRMPGAPDKDAFWRLLVGGADAVRDVPPDRWAADASTGRFGGFLEGIDRFDARFFRIPPDEADRMDPQQRLLLELAWHALEDAGQVPARLRGSRTGVFVGISFSDYGGRQVRDPSVVNGLTPTGNALSIAANRLSYLYDLRGPSMAVDTACSSSLVAVHLACQSIRGGECDAAMVAGVNVLLSPEVSMGLAAAGMLAPDGRCKAFDAAADGYVRSEGCGVLFLKPLSRARADEDPVYAVIRGSAVNQDGRGNGLTAPNPTAQRDVLAAAYEDAGVDPSTVQYVECHGTGTYLGDPIEATALGDIVGVGRVGESACLIGSAKTNVGHLEAAAGIVGLIKVALALHVGEIPPSIHFRQPNPEIPFDDLGLRVVTETMPWPTGAGGRTAGVSSFGFGGTNAHVVLEGPPHAGGRAADETPDTVHVMPVSARDDEALESLQRAWVERLADASETELGDLVYTAAIGRTHHARRLAVVGTDTTALAARLRESQRPGSVPPKAPDVAFVFPGQGSQWAGMGRDLLESDALFGSVIRRCDEALADLAPWRLESLLNTADEHALHEAALVQPLLCAVEIALATVWRSLGIEPAAVVGHSLGEVAAAHVAGALDLPAAMQLAYHRGRLMAPTAGHGRMLALGVDEDEARRLAESTDGVALAAVNGPAATVLAGEGAALADIAGRLESRRVFVRWLPVDHAFHSPQMEGPAADLRQVLDGLRPRPTQVPFLSTVAGSVRQGETLDAGYWAANVRQTVRFGDAVDAALDQGIDAFLDVGPQPVLGRAVRRVCTSRDRRDVPFLASLEPGRSDRVVVADSIARLYTLGCDIRWERVHPHGTVVSAPSYPFTGRRHWIEGHATPRHQGDGTHSLLGTEVALAVGDGRRVWEAQVGTGTMPELGDHRVHGTALLPASAVLHGFLAVAREEGLGDLALCDVRLHHPLALDEAPRDVQWTLVSGGQGDPSLSLHSRTDDGAWALHASASLRTEPSSVPDLSSGAVLARCLEQIPATPFYQALALHGLAYGPAFRCVSDVWRRDGEAIGRVHAPGGDLTRELDGGFQLLAAALGAHLELGDERLFVPVAVGQVHCWQDVGRAARAVVRVSPEAAAGADIVEADVVLLDDDDRAVVEVSGLTARAIGAPPAVDDEPGLWLYETAWRPEQRLVEEEGAEGARDPHPSLPTRGRWLVLADDDGVADALGGELAALGQSVIVARRGPAFCQVGSREFEADPEGEADMAALFAAASAEGALHGVVHLWGLGMPAPVVSVVELVKALSFAAGSVAPRLLLVTRGVHPVRGAHDARAPHGAELWGLSKVLPFENPLIRCRCVDLGPEGAEQAAAHLLAELTDANDDTEVAYRGGQRFLRRLAPTSLRDEGVVPVLRADGTYLVTGGLGGLGLVVAQWLVQRGAGRIALVSRHASPEAPGVADLAASGAVVRTIAADVADADQLASALASLRADGPPIRGVIHAAGVLDDGPLLEMSRASLNAVLRPKVDGAWQLHRLTADDPVEWFLLFSSAASVLGSPGQGNYCAANAFLDGLAAHRQGRDLPSMSICWGPWADVGMAAGLASDAADLAGGAGQAAEDRRLRMAASAIAPADGVAALDLMIAEAGRGTAQALVLPYDLRNLLQFYPAGAGLSFFDEVIDADAVATRSIGGQSRADPRPPLPIGYVAPRTPLEERIVAVWQRSLGIEPIGVDDGFFELGGDSVFANQMLTEINRVLGVSLDPEQAFDHLTVAGLAGLAERQMVARLEAMTEEEAARLVAEG